MDVLHSATITCHICHDSISQSERSSHMCLREVSSLKETSTGSKVPQAAHGRSARMQTGLRMWLHGKEEPLRVCGGGGCVVTCS